MNEKFHDKFDSSIMMSEEGTQIKNEILRKIKYQKMKKDQLPNFTRIEREKILQQREIEQRQLYMNQSQESLNDSACAATADNSVMLRKSKTQKSPDCIENNN